MIREEILEQEIKSRLNEFRQMGRHDLQSYLQQSAPDELPDSALDEVEEATLDWMNRRLASTPFEYLTAPDAFYLFMRKAFQHAEANLWRQAWGRFGMEDDERQRVLASWLDSCGLEETILRKFDAGTLSQYRVGGERYAIPPRKILGLAKAVRHSLLSHAEDHGVRHLFTCLPDDPTPSEFLTKA